MNIRFNEVADSILDIKVAKRTEVFNFGEDNAFPSLVEALVDMSVTAKTCVDRVAKAIYAGSFGKDGDVVVNGLGQSLNEVLRIAARQYAKHNNVFIAVGYNLNLEVTSIIVIPVMEVRAGKDDDKGYFGKYIVYDNWDKKKAKQIQTKKFKAVDRFSRNKEILAGQIEHSGNIRKYSGQMLHIKKDDSYIYSVTDMVSVMSDALLEADAQTFRGRGAKKGFLNTKLLATQPFKDDDTREEFSANLKAVRGADNSSEVILLEAAEKSDDLSKQINLQDLSSPYNDKLFEYSEKQAEKNICKAFSVPLVLVNPSDNSIFGNSGETLREAKLQLYQSKEEERNQLEEAFAYLMSRFVNPVEDISIVNPFEEVKKEEQND